MTSLNIFNNEDALARPTEIAMLPKLEGFCILAFGEALVLIFILNLRIKRCLLNAGHLFILGCLLNAGLLPPNAT
jgi:hypothetical protein